MRHTQLLRRLVFAVPLLFLAFAVAQPACAADGLQQVLAQLDASAKNFRSASAQFEFKNIQTLPVPDTDIMTGSVYYEHRGGSARMAAHVTQRNGRPYGAVYTYTGGVFQFYDKQLNQVRKLQNSANLAGYVSLGFGATGKELQDKFDVSYLGQETVDGVKTAKLQLIPKDPKTRNLFPKITIWIDPVRDVNLKQVFDEGQGMSRVCTYSHIEMNRSIPSSVFKFKTNKQTQFINQ